MDEKGNLARALSNLQEAQVLSLVNRDLQQGVSATDILTKCRQGLADVGRRFQQAEYYVPELMYAGVIVKKVVDKLEPMLKESPELEPKAATVVIGTVHRDIHDIGKDIVVLMLRGSGFEVIDLGVDVPPEKFVRAVKENDATVLGMSVFLTSCCRSIAETVDAIKQANLRDNVSIMIGGAAASNMVSERTGCDYYGQTAVDAVNHAKTVARPV